MDDQKHPRKFDYRANMVDERWQLRPRLQSGTCLQEAIRIIKEMTKNSEKVEDSLWRRLGRASCCQACTQKMRRHEVLKQGEEWQRRHCRQCREDEVCSLCEIWLPILNGPLWSAKSLGWPFLACLGIAGAFFVLVCVGCSNAVNLTDGLDGLAIGCVLITTMILGAVAYLAGHHEFATYLRISYVPGAGELAVFCSALVGGSLVFLWHNAAPAEIYMGDVGALGLGGGLGAVACLMHQPFLLAIVGGVFVVEAASVILQVAYFKRTGGQRLFLMTPIHHHFQKKGWPATKVVARFWILSLLCGLLGLLSLKLR